MTLLWPALTVRDVEVSLAFYNGVLGFPRDLAERDEWGVTFLGSVEVRETVIMFKSPGPNVTLDPELGARSGVTLTLCLPHAADLDGLYARLRRDGVNICSPIGNRPWGTRGVSIRDPDG